MRSHPSVRPVEILLFVALGLLAPFSSGQTAQKQPAAAPKAGASQTNALGDDGLPPVVRQSWKGDLDAMAQRRVVRVLVPFRRPEFFYMEGRPAGILQEVFSEIEKLINLKYKTTAANRIIVALLPTPMDKLQEKMVGGYGDITAAGIAITKERKDLVDFTNPVMTDVKILVVTGPGAPELKTVEDLSGKEVWVPPASKMKQDLQDLNVKLKGQGKALVTIRETDPVLEPGDVLEMTNAGIYPITLSQSVQANFWGQVFDKITVRKDLALSTDVQLGWAIQKDTPQLRTFLNDFLKTHGVGTAFGNTLLQRYLKSAKFVRNATEVSEMQKFRATLPYFKDYSNQYGLDYLMMAAQGYQESRLDQNVKSPVGAVGIMQVMPSTAASAPVKVPDISTEKNNILAGARLMHYLIEDHFNQPELDLKNKMLFAIAAYNAGPANIEKCRALAKKMGYDPNVWFNNVEVATAKIIGRETTQYVANIYKYYVCYRLAGDTNRRRQAAEVKAGLKSKTK